MHRVTPELVGPTESDAFVLLDSQVYVVASGRLTRFSITTGVATELAEAPSGSGIAVADGVIYWTDPGAPGNLALHSLPLPD